MRFFTTIALTISAAVAQEIGATSGDKVSAGASAIAHPNVNNGVQTDGSLFVSGTGSGESSLFNNVFGGHFVNANLNTAIEDNLVNNPGFNSVSGSSGWIANGDGNALGAVQNTFGKREYHAALPAAPAYHAPAVYHPVAPYAAVAPIIVPAPVQYYAPVFHTRPAPAHYAAPVAEKPAHYAAPVAEKPAHYAAPVAEKPAHYAAPAAPEYHAPVTAPEHTAPPAAPAYHAGAPVVPVESKHSSQTATIIQNQA
ncbi:hypothetical protein IWW50_000079 [Coemansia erecta]|nr:hypothetical protein GGF43_000361 [Coemansia sp. RSA 2618]KAJ2830722.1 hypothetical protein IWW50_000079 [Coemansia erecta]